MNRWGHAAFTFVAFAGALLAGPATARADLFAIATTTNQVLRINSSTLGVTHTYDSPIAFGSPSAFVGAAFDGRILSWTRSLAGGAIHELIQFDVVSESWGPPLPLFEIMPPYQLAGLGALGPESGGALLGVASTMPVAQLPSMFYRIEPFGFALPLGELPPQYNALGLDIDPDTGEIWVAARNLEATPAQFELLRVSLPGFLPELAANAGMSAESPQPAIAGPTIEQAIQLAFLPAAPPRGVGFDNGGMYVISATRTLAEVNRADGTILRSVQLPGTFLIGGLAGGTVVPEPSGLILMALAALGAMGCGRR
jgi:hypothetical protein